MSQQAGAGHNGGTSQLQHDGEAVRAPAEVEGPVGRGAVLGRAVVSVGGMRAATVPLRAGRAVPEAGALERARSFVEGNPGWIALALLGILSAVALLMRRRSR